MTEKYEAHAYIKIKDEENKEGEKQKIETTKNFLSLLGRLLFERALREVYDEGIKSAAPNTIFMLRLTDFFVSCTASFYISKKSQEEIIQEISSFLDAVKQDTLQTIEQTFKVEKELKF